MAFRWPKVVSDYLTLNDTDLGFQLIVTDGYLQVSDGHGYTASLSTDGYLVLQTLPGPPVLPLVVRLPDTGREVRVDTTRNVWVQQ